MKKIFYLSLLLPLFLFSCKSTPEAHFYTDTVSPEVGREVYFTNDSHNAKKFEWDFGDGFISNAENPSHIYTGTGTYEVTLTAISRSGLDDKAKLTIEVLIPTLLEVEVREYYDEYTVSGASVILYPTKADWTGQTNETTEGLTDADGIVVFSGLDPFVYYVDVWEKDHDNYMLAGEDINFITTPTILPHKINRFTAWVDYYPQHTKGEGSRARKVIIRKLERKATDKMQPSAVSDTEGWQQLYNRRAGQK
jgi:hypothetical protein